MWFIFVNAFIYSLDFIFNFKFKDFFISSILFLLIYFFYEKMKRNRALALGYQYKKIFNFKYLIFSSILSIATAGFLRFFYFGSFHLESSRNSLQIKDYPKIIILPILILLLLSIISLFVHFYMLYTIILIFVVFNLLPIPGYDGAYLFASDIKKYKSYVVALMFISILSIILENSLFMIILSFLVILYIYHDYNKNDKKKE
ncbi:MAG: hypothetical protein PHT94_00210 [Candidatus Nanoarchaeia archaeon]|nr:hypothetical protein [Candidatus Nanoarchaeia archaeon]